MDMRQIVPRLVARHPQTLYHRCDAMRSQINGGKTAHISHSPMYICVCACIFVCETETETERHYLSKHTENGYCVASDFVSEFIKMCHTAKEGDRKGD